MLPSFDYGLHRLCALFTMSIPHVQCQNIPVTTQPLDILNTRKIDTDRERELVIV